MRWWDSICNVNRSIGRDLKAHSLGKRPSIHVADSQGTLQNVLVVVLFIANMKSQLFSHAQHKIQQCFYCLSGSLSSLSYHINVITGVKFSGFCLRNIWIKSVRNWQMRKVCWYCGLWSLAHLNIHLCLTVWNLIGKNLEDKWVVDNAWDAKENFQ